MTLQDVCVYADPEERNEIFEYLDGLEVEYHKEYKRFNKIVHLWVDARDLLVCAVCVVQRCDSHGVRVEALRALLRLATAGRHFVQRALKLHHLHR